MNNTAILSFDSDKVTMTTINGAGQIVLHYGADFAGIMDENHWNRTEFQTTICSLVEQSQGYANTIYVVTPSIFCTVMHDEAKIEFAGPTKIKAKHLQEICHQAPAHAIHRTIMYYTVDDGSPVLNPIGLVGKKLVIKYSSIICKPQFIDLIATSLQGSDFTSIRYTSRVLCDALHNIDEATRDKACVLIQCDLHTTAVATIYGDSLFSVDTINMGYAHLINDLSIVKEVSYDIASELVKVALPNIAKSEKDFFQVILSDKKHFFDARQTNDIVSSRLEDIGGEILRVGSNVDEAMFQKPVFIYGQLGERNDFRQILGKTMNVHLRELLTLQSQQRITKKTLLDSVINFIRRF